MKKINFVFWLCLSFLWIFLVGCSKEESRLADEGAVWKTRAAAEFGWRCTKCGMSNPGWRTICVNNACKNEYHRSHGDMILNVFSLVSDKVKTSIDGNGSGGSGGSGEGDHALQLRNGKFPAYLPEPWYENSGALKYYDKIKRSSIYMLTPGYAEAADYAWYQTTRILYPKLHDKTKVETTYTKFMLREDKNFSGFQGQGLKDGSRAAIDAFVAR